MTTVLSVAYPFAPVGPQAVGGAERILTDLEAALPACGIHSVVAAREDSQPAGRLFPTPRIQGTITPQFRTQTEAAHQQSIDRALAAGRVDLIHMHGIDFHRYRLPPGIPTLVTLHLPPSWYPSFIWCLPANIHLQCVSHHQRSTCPKESLPVIENAVALPSFPPARKSRFALTLSRICPEKNLHLAIDAARLARIPLLIAGEVFPYPEHLAYFEQQIRPRLGPGVRFLGPITGAAKQRLLARAACLLLPTVAPETSSLVAMEALAAGTPVIALPSGAIPDIVTHGRTGFLVHTAAEMAAALQRLPEISPETCRAEAESRFPLPRMIAGYLALYQTLLCA